MRLPAQEGFRLPAPVRAAPLYRQGGYEVVDGMLERRALAAMRREALGLLPRARLSERAEPVETVGGVSPERRFRSALGGPLNEAFYQSARVLNFLCDAAGARVRLTGHCGSYSYYLQPGDFLGVHRDVVACDVTLVTCLQDHASPGAPGGCFVAYPSRVSETIAAIRATPGDGVLPIRLEPGQTLVILGGVVPHAVSPVSAGQERIVSVLCYEIEV